MTTTSYDIDAHLTNPEFFAGFGFHDLFRHLRENDPVHWTQGNYARGYWSLSSYQDCVTLMSDPVLFSVKAGPHLPPLGRDLTPEEERRFGVDTHILMSDPPNHGRRRRPLNKHFSVPVVTGLRPLFEQVVTEILDAAEAKNDIDLVADIAAPLPVKVILRLLGVPENDWAAISTMAVRALHSQDAEFLDVEHDALTAVVAYIDKVYEYLAGLIRDRRATPAQDYATIIAELTDGADLFTEREAAFMAVGFVLGGLEGTRNAVSVGLWELMRHPEQARALAAANPVTVRSAVEEVLRWSTPSKNRLRVATADTVISGHTIHQGDWVVGWITSANRDEDVFTHADAFDITRSPNKHLAFGLGDHTCLGRAMARLEMDIMLPEVFRRFPELAATGDAEWVVSDNATGLKRLPVRLRPRPDTAGDGN